MNTYEDYRRELIIELGKVIKDNNTLLQAIGAVDFVSNQYEVSPKNKALISQANLNSVVINNYLASCKCGGIKGGQSNGTIENKYYAINKFFKSVQKSYKDVCTNDIRAYLYMITDTVSNKSAEKARQYISGFYKFCVLEKLINDNPCLNIGQIRTEKAEISPLTNDEMYRLRNATQTKFEKALVEFLYSTGARIAEAATIKISDLDFYAKEAHLIGKGQKHRTTFISISCEYALKEYLNSREDNNPHLFVSSRGQHEMTTKALRNHIHEISNRVGLKVNPHQIRHTTATNLQGVMPIQNISKYLGHESISTTMVYAKIDRKAMKLEFERGMC